MIQQICSFCGLCCLTHSPIAKGRGEGISHRRLHLLVALRASHEMRYGAKYTMPAQRLLRWRTDRLTAKAARRVSSCHQRGTVVVIIAAVIYYCHMAPGGMAETTWLISCTAAVALR